MVSSWIVISKLRFLLWTFPQKLNQIFWKFGVEFQCSLISLFDLGLFQWRWGPQTSDGIVMGPFPLYQTKFLDRGYCIKPRIILSNGLSATPIYLATVTTSGGTQTTTYLPVGSDSRFCVYMCSQYCFMYESCIECNRNASQCIWCSATQQYFSNFFLFLFVRIRTLSRHLNSTLFEMI